MKCNSLVSLDKWVVLCQAKTVAGCQFRQIRFGRVEKTVPWAGQCGLQQTLVTNSLGTAMDGQTCGMQVKKCLPINPARLFHLANARKVSRYLAINSKPSFTCSSTSGSKGVSRRPPGVSVAKRMSFFLTRKRCSTSLGRITPVEVPTERSLSFMS